MSYIKLNISDRDGAISGDVHGSMTDVVVAALTAEPETIAEFEKAIGRFIETESDWGPFRGFRKDEDLEAYDAGIVAIDLHARVIGYETTYSLPSKEGMVRVPNKFADEKDEDIYVPYHLPDDWIIVETIPLFEGADFPRQGGVRPIFLSMHARSCMAGRSQPSSPGPSPKNPI